MRKLTIRIAKMMLPSLVKLLEPVTGPRTEPIQVQEFSQEPTIVHRVNATPPSMTPIEEPKAQIRQVEPLKKHSRSDSSLKYVSNEPTESWCSQRTALEIFLICLCSVSVALCMALVIALFVEEQKLSYLAANKLYQGVSSNGESVHICSTPECTQAAGAILKYMDPSVDPCQDFFKYACGKWTATTSQFGKLDAMLFRNIYDILNQPIVSTDIVTLQWAKTYYKTCSNTSLLNKIGLSPLLNFINNWGGWPMISNNWQPSNFNWQNLLALSAGFGNRYLLSVSVSADKKNNNISTLYIDQPSLALAQSVLLKANVHLKTINAYKAFIVEAANVLSSSTNTTISPGDLEADVTSIINLEMRLANLSSSAGKRRDSSRMYNPFTITQLQTFTSAYNFNWLPYLNTVFANTNITLTADTRVIVVEKAFILGVLQLLETLSARQIANYIIWRTVKRLGDETTILMRNASFHFRMVVNGATSPQVRSDSCLDSTNDFFGMSVGYAYVKLFLKDNVKDEVQAMADDIQITFEEMLFADNWMDASTTNRAVMKLKAMTKFIGYPAWYSNNSALEDYYSGLGGMSPTNHFQNYLTICWWLSTGNLVTLFQPTDRDSWLSPPTTVNAFYLTTYNSITFPAGILQPPFYSANTIQALNYGAIGSVIGHELTHGFDDKGRQYDQFGNVEQWWSNDTLRQFQIRQQCMIDLYNGFRVPEIDHLLPNATVNGQATQGENIADNGGIREAYYAYHKYQDRHGTEARLPGLDQFSPLQLFFLSNANMWCDHKSNQGLLNQILTDAHSPHRFRVNGMLGDMVEFSQIWNCPSGSNMNPVHKCVVW